MNRPSSWSPCAPARPGCRLSITRWWRAGAGLLLLTLTALCARAAGPKHVLILEPFEGDVAPFSVALSAFRTTLAREHGERLEFYEMTLDRARFQVPETEGPLVQFLETRIANRPMDLVVTTGGPGMDFAGRHHERLFPETPIVLIGGPPEAVQAGSLAGKATQVTVSMNLAGMVEDILQLQPQTTNIAVVFGASALETDTVEQCRREFERFTDRVAFSWLNQLPLEQILAECARLPPRSFILHGLFVVDAAGIPYARNEALRRLHQVANAPLFGYFASELGLGTIGGRLFQDAEVGAQAARAANRILRGERPGNIPPQMLAEPVPVYDWRELRRWNISEARLPAGSVIRFRQPDFWELYRWPISGAVSVCLLQAALIAGLLANRAKRKGAEERFRLAVEGSPNGMVLLNHQRRIVLVNTQAEMLFGYSRAELIGQDVEMLVPERFRRAHSGLVNDFFSAPQSSAMGARRELLGCRKDGTEFPVEIALNPIQSREGLLVLVAIADLTARRQAEKEAKELRGNLAHAGRVTVLGQLASALAHELSQPLGAILRNAETAEIMLQRPSPDLEELRSIVTDILRDDQRAGQVIDRLRSLLKRGSLDLQPIELSSVIAEVLSLVHADAAARHVKLTYSVAPGLPLVRGDRVHLQQVVLNLLVNAMDALESCAPQQRNLEVRAHRTDATACEVRVSDNGPGLPGDALERLFEPFFTTKAKGMGMGLAVSKTIIESHKGRLWAENRPAGGACFCFTLPVARG